MKKAISLLLALMMVLSLAACGGSSTATNTPAPTEAPQPTEPPAPTKVTSTDYITIDGICIDNSWKDDNNAALRMVYLFYTLSSKDENLKIDSKYTKLTINDGNSYESSNYAAQATAVKYTKNYYYGDYIEDVYIGTSFKVAATFKIPEGDLAAGRTITVTDDQIPGVEALRLSTDDIQYFDNGELIASAIDPDGYKTAMVAYEEADAETIRRVKELVNGYSWWCYVNNTKYDVEFWADNNFGVATSLGTTATGTYSVRNGYIFCTYTDTGHTIEIPYEFTADDIKLDVADAFDVKSN